MDSGLAMYAFVFGAAAPFVILGILLVMGLGHFFVVEPAYIIVRSKLGRKKPMKVLEFVLFTIASGVILIVPFFWIAVKILAPS